MAITVEETRKPVLVIERVHGAPIVLRGLTLERANEILEMVRPGASGVALLPLGDDTFSFSQPNIHTLHLFFEGVGDGA